ncbi:hypothetical protein NXS19_004183 [Fusarium pseudograminearum]|nr:hypothetical protein NXS19_004183 [Fusarium pseudograminearum]
MERTIIALDTAFLKHREEILSSHTTCSSNAMSQQHRLRSFEPQMSSTYAIRHCLLPEIGQHTTPDKVKFCGGDTEPKLGAHNTGGEEFNEFSFESEPADFMQTEFCASFHPTVFIRNGTTSHQS